MDYLLIIILQCIGFGLRCLQTIAGLRKTHPDKSPNDVINTFVYEDWNTFAVSFLVLALDLTVHYIVSKVGIDWTGSFQLGGLSFNYATSYQLLSYAIAFILGYAGQHYIYKWLGTATERLDKEITDKLQK